MKRVFEIDLIKAIVLIIMPVSHVYDEFGLYYDLMNNIPSNVVEQLGLLFMNGSALFMICLGLGIIFSKNSTPEKLAMRGISMFIIQAILNIFRFTIPYTTTAYITKETSFFKESLELFVSSDILSFAGFAFLFFALVKKLNLSNKLVLFIGLFLSIIQMTIPQIEIQNVYLKNLTSHFIYVDKESFFPVISWLIYPIIGYLLGQKYIENANKNNYYLKTGFLGLILFVFTNFYLFLTNSMNPDYYLFMETGFHMDFFTTLIVASTSLILISLIYFISKIFIDSKIKNLIISISKNINSIYCIHWVIVKTLWAFAIIFAFKLDYNYVFIIGFVIFIISALLAQLRKNLKKVL